MSETNSFQGPDLTKPHNFFAFVIDGEVAWKHMLYEEHEQLTAVYSSDPKVVIIPENLSQEVGTGWTYQDGIFSPPA